MKDEKCHVVFDDPSYHPGRFKFYYEGGSPKILDYLKSYLAKHSKQIVSLRLSLYLLNNYELHKAFLQLAQEGVEVHVVSIPLEGYDRENPQPIFFRIQEI